MSTESRSWQPRARTVVACNLAGACFGPLNVVLQTAAPFRRDGGEGVALTHSLIPSMAAAPATAVVDTARGPMPKAGSRKGFKPFVADLKVKSKGVGSFSR